MSSTRNEVLEATESFACELGGQLYNVGAGITRIAADHPLAQAYPQHFRPVEEGLTFRTEETTAEPDRPRERYARQRAPRQPSPVGAPEQSQPQPPAQGAPADAGTSQADAPSGLSSQSIIRKEK